MIAGIGIDSIEKERIAEAAERWGDRFFKKVFTPRELRDCRNKHDRNGSMAARFAAKEAALKALGTGWSEGLRWKDVEVVGGPGGKPELVFHRKARDRALGKRVHLSLTHDIRTAVAVVIIEKEEG